MADQLAAVLNTAQPQGFEALLDALCGVDNTQRAAAEAVFTAAKAHPEPLVAQLVRCLRTCARQELREMAAVLLRKTLTGGEVSCWSALSASTQAGVKGELLKSVQEETVVRITHKVGDVICELAATLLEEGTWPELLPFLFAAVQGGSEALREAALLIFSQLALYVGSQLGPHLPTLFAVFQTHLAGGSLGVRVAALTAAGALVSALPEPAQRRPFQELLPAMLGTLSTALGSDEERAQEVLTVLVELAESDARFYRKYIAEVALAMLTVAEHTTLEVPTRQLALEFLVTLAEAREQAPGMIRKMDALVGRMLTACVGFLLDVEDDPGWASAEAEADLDAGQGEMFDVGMECLDRLSCALGAKAVLPVMGQLVPGLMASGDWRQRHAGLCALSQVAEGCAKYMKKDPGGAASPALTALGDPHPRVRWAAINAIGQLCTDLGPELQAAAHARLLPALLAVMDDTANPRVQSHAAAATVNFAEQCEAEVLAQYMDALIMKLLTLLQSGRKPVQEAALTALAAVADAAQAQFARYYDTVMPILVQALQTANEPGYRMLRAKALECATLVGMAVGKQRFAAHAQPVIDVMVRLQNTPAGDDDAADDPTHEYLLSGWARLCSVMGAEFVPYLAVVMPPLFAAAGRKPDVRVRDAGEGGGEEEEDCELIAVGDQVLAIRTSALEEKAQACSMLCCYVDQLGAGFLPYLERTAELMVPLLKFYFSEEVRTAAVSIVPSLLKAGAEAVAAGSRDASWFSGLLAAVWPPLLEALHKEPDADVTCAMLIAAAEACTAAGAALLPAHLESLTAELKAQLEASAARGVERATQQAGEDWDEDEKAAHAEEESGEDELVDAVQECVSQLLKTFKSAYLPYLTALGPSLVPLLSHTSPTLRRIAVCIADDVLEFGGVVEGGVMEAATAPYFDVFFPALLAGAASPYPDLRQASVYGIGVAAQHCTSRFRGQAAAAAQVLLAVIRAPGARAEDAADASDNAASALGKACEYAGDAFDSAAALAAWLDYLPLKADREEARTVHDQLCRFVAAGDARLLGAANERLGRVVAIFADCLAAEDLLSPAGRVKVRELLLRMQTSLAGTPALGAAWAALSPAQQTALGSAMAGAPA